MNLLVDPGAEIQSPAWVVTDVAMAASFSQDQVHAGAWSLKLPRVLFGEEAMFWVSGQFTQSAIPLSVGDTMNVSAWVYATATAANVGLRIEYDRGDGVFTAQNFNSLPLGWSLVTVPGFTATGGVGRIRLTVNGPLTGAALVYVDDVVWDWPAGDLMARRHKHAAYNAVIARLKTIAGAPNYHIDLGQRAYPLLFLPEEKKDVHLPYACFPLIDTFNIVDNERASVEVDWEADIHLFVKDTSSNSLASVSSETIAKAADDVIKAFKADETLGGACQNMTLLGGASVAGALVDGQAYAELIFRIRITQVVGVDVLGPE